MRRFAVLSLLVVAGCPPPMPGYDGGYDAGPGEVCMPVAPTMCTETQLRWADIEPVIVSRCFQCHDGSQPQWPLRTYSDVADWADIVRGDIVDCTMPPLDSGVSMTNAERRLILDWIKCSYPR
ncbi:MAG: hypothetical protein QM817_21055 [Archangium sp.]